MKRRLYIICLFVMALFPVESQEFQFGNSIFPTRIGASDGPLAGAGIWAQMLAGSAPENLILIGIPVEHINGYAVGGVVVAPHMECFTIGYVQMVAWDGRLWGDNFNTVPTPFVGRTDVVRQYFSCHPDPLSYPQFTQPAIVPIPEPSPMVLLVFLGPLVFLLSRIQNPCTSLKSAHRQASAFRRFTGAGRARDA